MAFFACGVKSYIHTAVDPEFLAENYDRKQNKVYVFLRSDAAVEEKQLHPILVNELSREGFIVTKNVEESRISIIATFGEYIARISSSALVASNSSGTGKIGNTNYSSNSNSYSIVPTEERVGMKSIYIVTYDTQGVMSQERQGPLWEGYVDGKRDEVLGEADLYFRKLLTEFGRNSEESFRFFMMNNPEMQDSTGRLKYNSGVFDGTKNRFLKIIKVPIRYSMSSGMAERIVKNPNNPDLKRRLAEEKIDLEKSTVSYRIAGVRKSNPGHVVDVEIFVALPQKDNSL